MAKVPVAVQMYTLRDLTSKDFVGTLEKVAAIGYAGVELAGTGGLSAAELKGVLARLKLAPAGAHVGIESFEGDLEKTMAYYSELGCKTLIVPWLSEDRRKGPDGWAKLGRFLEEVGGKLKARGLSLAYHNHDFEFQKVDGKYALDVLFEAAPKNLKMELDLYWAKRGGEDPHAYAAKYSGRVTHLHVKDMAAGPDKHFAPVGTGVIDFSKIFAEASSWGVEWFVVEQDDCYGTPPLDAIATSFKNLQKAGVV